MKLLSKASLVSKLLVSKKFRDAYVYEHIKNGVPFQIRAMREERGWTQTKLGEVSEKPRNVITRLEDPNYGKLTIKTLLEIASAFDVALLIRFIPFSRLLREYDDTSSSALGVPSISREAHQLKKWAQSKAAANVSGIQTAQLSLPMDEWANLVAVASRTFHGNVFVFRPRDVEVAGVKYENAVRLIQETGR